MDVRWFNNKLTTLDKYFIIHNNGTKNINKIFVDFYKLKVYKK